MNYNLEEHLRDVYGSFPEGKRRPVIGISANYDWDNGMATLGRHYYEQVVRAGGVPVLIPAVADKDVIASTLESIDGLILSGGADLNPLWAGEEPSPRLHHINRTRDLPELLLVRMAFNKQIPMLGICRGIQTMAVALGGEVEQDISAGATIQHSQDADRNEQTHSVRLEEGSLVRALYNKETIHVNSFHHQAVRATGEKFRPTAWAPDGTIEAMESTEEKALMGVQWHPECLEDDGLPLFRWIVGEAETFRKAKELHSRFITLDSHCDTPMFFHEDADFSRRDDKVLVDLHKMADGRQDVVTMVAYLPQPKEPKGVITGEEELMTSPLYGEKDVMVRPHEYADKIFDHINEIIAREPDHIALARCREDILKNKVMGRKSVMIGIENGLAVEKDLDLVNHFADRGIVYITLCHNGDNQICDSARRSNNTWGGVSDFGRQVIERMNECGVTVDMSHAAESSFYDALEISRRPIVCSHSNCKALCDSPRNLTDDQLKALARKDGVCQITLYPGFLRTEGEASILDAMEHLDHAIRIMGVEHVGLGSDFDGDGGVRGLANSSEMIQFTRQLLKRRYSDEEIEMIWGGNWIKSLTPNPSPMRRGE